MIYRDDLLAPSAAGPIIPGQREPPPEDLTPKQQAIWVEIVADLDRDWFSETRPLLKELVCHIDYARELASLLRQHGRQTSSIANLSTKLRLTPQARQSARGADQVRRRTGTRPWERWQAD